jgi:cytochrome P450
VIGVRAVLAPILVHKQAFTRVVNEINESCCVNSLLNRDVTYTEHLQLPYLQAAIKDGMRPHPSIRFQLPRFTLKEGVSICGEFLSEGTWISIPPRAMNRDPVFCPDVRCGGQSGGWRIRRELLGRIKLL